MSDEELMTLGRMLVVASLAVVVGVFAWALNSAAAAGDAARLLGL